MKDESKHAKNSAGADKEAMSSSHDDSTSRTSQFANMVPEWMSRPKPVRKIERPIGRERSRSDPTQG
jgi:hypothetical protein